MGNRYYHYQREDLIQDKQYTEMEIDYFPFIKAT